MTWTGSARAQVPHVAIVDDDPLFLETLAANLRHAGFRVGTFAGMRSIVAALIEGLRPRVILIEAHHARRDNAALPLALRAVGFSGTIVLIAPDAPGREIDGTTAAWIARTLPPEMILRSLRRLMGRTDETFTLGDLTLRYAADEAMWCESIVALTHAEFAILAQLAARAGVTVAYREIFRTAQQDLLPRRSATEGLRMRVRAAVDHMGRKFIALDSGFDALEHHAGLGYRWRFPADAGTATSGQGERLSYN